MRDRTAITPFVAALIATFALVRCGTSPSIFVEQPAVQELTAVAPATTAAVTSQFRVSFEGIVVFVAYPRIAPTLRRAVVIQADLFQPHYPMIWVNKPSNPADLSHLKASLNAASGQIVHCNGSQCGVRIRGLAMRIRGNGQPPITPLDVTPSFMCLVPHLYDDPYIRAGAIKSDVIRTTTSTTRAVLPAPPSLGFFEIENGILEARAFARTGMFTGGPCREFAKVTTWSGETDGDAILEIASDDSAWKWKKIEAGNAGPLTVYVENVSSHVSQHHFALNSKIVANQSLPMIMLDCGAPATPCPAAGGFGSINAVPGCSDNQWP